MDIYEHRISNAAEISGAVNLSYMALEEHLLLYFIEKSKEKKRIKIENAVLEFLISLKAHMTAGWDRACLFSQLYGFI